MCVDMKWLVLLCYMFMYNVSMLQTVRDMSHDMNALYCMSFQLPPPAAFCSNERELALKRL
jgi:hypothetical protein